MTPTAIIRIPSQMVMGAAIKNYVCYIGVDNVRKNLQALITDLVKPYLGTYVAPIVGNQLGLAYAMPATLVYADMISTAVKELLGLVYRLFSSIFFGIEPKKQEPVFHQLVIKTSSFVASYFAKNYFCNYGMPFVHTALRTGITFAGPLVGIPGPAVTGFAILIPLYAAPVTFAVGDMAGSAAWYSAYWTQKIMFG